MFNPFRVVVKEVVFYLRSIPSGYLSSQRIGRAGMGLGYIVLGIGYAATPMGPEMNRRIDNSK